MTFCATVGCRTKSGVAPTQTAPVRARCVPEIGPRPGRWQCAGLGLLQPRWRAWQVGTAQVDQVNGGLRLLQGVGQLAPEGFSSTQRTVGIDGGRPLQGNVPIAVGALRACGAAAHQHGKGQIRLLLQYLAQWGWYGWGGHGSCFPLVVCWGLCGVVAASFRGTLKFDGPGVFELAEPAFYIFG